MKPPDSVTLYVNGLKRSEDPWDGIFDGVVTAWIVGSSWDYYHNGKFKIDELRIYNRDLSESEIQQIIGQ